MISRRDVLGGAAAGLFVVKPETAFGSQANPAVSFGVVGTGGRGTTSGRHMAEDTNARLTAIYDIYPDRIQYAKTQLPTADKVVCTATITNCCRSPTV